MVLGGPINHKNFYPIPSVYNLACYCQYRLQQQTEDVPIKQTNSPRTKQIVRSYGRHK